MFLKKPLNFPVLEKKEKQFKIVQGFSNLFVIELFCRSPIFPLQSFFKFWEIYLCARNSLRKICISLMLGKNQNKPENILFED